MELNQDELGDLGQSLFQTACGQSKLIANGSNRDRTGWDFRVEYPNSTLKADEPFDKRKTPLPIMIQVKAVMDGTTKITASLRTFERLIKIPEPAFIMIPVIDDAHKLKQLFGIHLVGKALEKTLKSLARIHQKGRDISDSDTISFSKGRWWKEITLSEALPVRSFLESAIKSYTQGSDYIAKKAGELATIGYGKDANIAGSVTILANDEDDLIDGFLGLRTLQVSTFSVKETRFGLERPLHPTPSGVGTLKVTPTKKHPCILRIHNEHPSDPIDIPAEITGPGLPGLPMAKARFLVDVENVRLNVSMAGKLTISVSGLEEVSHPVSRWLHMFQVIAAIANTKARIEFLSPEYSPFLTANGVVLDEKDTRFKSWAENLRRIAENLQYVLKRANLSDLTLDYATLTDDCEQIAKFRYLLEDKNAEFSTKFTLHTADKTLEYLEGRSSLCLVQWLEIKGITVVCIVQALATSALQGHEITLHCTSTGSNVVTPVGSREAYDDLVNRWADKSQTQLVADLPEKWIQPDDASENQKGQQA